MLSRCYCGHLLCTLGLVLAPGCKLHIYNSRVIKCRVVNSRAASQEPETEERDIVREKHHSRYSYLQPRSPLDHGTAGHAVPAEREELEHVE